METARLLPNDVGDKPSDSSAIDVRELSTGEAPPDAEVGEPSAVAAPHGTGAEPERSFGGFAVEKCGPTAPPGFATLFHNLKSRSKGSWHCIVLLIALVLLLLVPLVIAAVIRGRPPTEPSLTPILPEMRALYDNSSAGFALSADLFATSKTKQYVFTTKPRGCPFIFTVPHGGSYNISSLGYPARVGGVSVQDTRTLPLVSAAYEEVKRLTNGTVSASGSSL